MITKLYNATIYTMNESHDVIENGIILIDGHKIQYIGKDCEQYFDQKIDCKGGILLPGLINGCIKMGKGVIRNDHKNIDTIIHEINESNYLEECDLKNIVQNTIIQMLKQGVTTIFDYSNQILEYVHLYKDGNLRVFGNVKQLNHESLMETYSVLKSNNITPFLYSERTFQLQDNELLPMVEFLKESGASVHFPVHQSLVEIGECLKMYNQSPMEWLDNLGILQFPHQLLHGTSMDKEDMEFLMKNNSSITICPNENLSMGLGFPPVVSYLRKGINVKVGTGVSIIGKSNLIDELKIILQLSRMQFHQPNILKFEEILTLCTKNYNHLGLGVLQNGNFADIILVDSDQSSLEDIVFNIQDKLNWTMVNGKIVYQR